MSPRHVLLRAALAASVALAAGCDLLDSNAMSEFPDAGPGGPDSTFAGVGRGIPMGETGLTDDRFGRPYTGALLPTSRRDLGRLLTRAQAGKTRLVLNLAGSSNHYTNPDGTFNLDLWKGRVDRFRDVDFAPYVTEGLVLAHFLVDEPYWPGSWGGRTISSADIEEMARYSKSIWPTLPTAVRAPPGLLKGFDWQYLDIAWAQWAGPLHGAATGQTPEEFRDENVARAKALNLGLIFGLNYLDGGDGSSGIRGTTESELLWQMTAAEIERVGIVLATTPYACALLSWKYEPAFESRPEIREAIARVAAAAADRGGTSCLRRGQ